MYCQHCGSSLPPGAQYCANCGKRVSTDLFVPVQSTVDNGSVIGRADSDSAEGSQIRPWVRYWSRMLDILLFSFPAGFLIGVLRPSLFETDDPGRDYALGLVVMLAWAFVEPLCLSVFGTTPGRSLFRIRVVRQGEQKIGYTDALGRSLKVWWRGMAAGVPLISLFTLGAAYNRLKRAGQTSWDEEGGFVVQHRKVGVLRTLAAIAIFMLILAAIGAASTQG